MPLFDTPCTQHRIPAGLRSCAIGFTLVVAAAGRMDAQAGAWTRDSALVASRSPSLTRADLEDLTQRVGRLATSETVRPSERDAFAVLGRSFRDRLTEGDFKPGDEILLRVEGQESLSGTFAVRERQILSLPSLPDICLRGVLHAELKEFLTRGPSTLSSERDAQSWSLAMRMRGGLDGRCDTDMRASR